MRRPALKTALLTVALAACNKAPSSNDAGACDCSTIVCGSLCGKVCAVCPNDGVCAADNMSCRAALPIGASCGTDIACGENRSCLSATNGVQAPNGYCTKACNANEPCPSGSTCGVDTKGDSVCLADCTAATPCRSSDGYTCSSAGTCNACVGNCTGKTCGDDGCGNQCGVTQAMTPACAQVGQVCISNECTGGFGVIAQLPYSNGLWDAAALASDKNGVAIIVGGREVAQYTGGQIESRGITTVETFTPGASTQFMAWPAPLPEPVARPHAAYFSTSTFGPTIVVAGGINDPDDPTSPDGIAPDLLVYDTMSEDWKSSNQTAGMTVSAIPEPSMGGGLAQLGSVVYLVVGEVSNGSGGYTSSNSMYSYDPVGDIWGMAPSRPTARSFMGVVSDGNFLYVIGGSDGMHALATVEVFSVATGWTTTQSLVVPAVDPKVAIASGRVFVFGGRTGLSQEAPAVPYVQSVDLSTHDTLLLGETYQALTGQAPVSLQQGPFILAGALQFASLSTSPMVDDDVLQFTVPPE